MSLSTEERSKNDKKLKKTINTRVDAEIQNPVIIDTNQNFCRFVEF